MIKVNSSPTISMVKVGKEETPIIVIDNFFEDYESLIELACHGEAFQANSSDYYPGIRKVISTQYSLNVCHFLQPFIQQHYNQRVNKLGNIKPELAVFSITNTSPNKLRPIQTLPHFDTTAVDKFAVVHYLCDEHHGGTDFYLHNETEYESITSQRLPHYGSLLKQQAVKAELHKNLSYMSGDNGLFTQIYRVAAKMNRAVLYPSNLLHSGNILQKDNLSSFPSNGRLTANYFLTPS